MKLIFATNNENKLKEIRSVLGDEFEILGLKESGISEDLAEEQDDLEGNALQKARQIYNLTGMDCFSDDTGLEVEALDGAPGVYSARYAGEHATSEDNMNKLLKELEGKASRRARFRTVIALILEGHEFVFEGICNGYIIEEKRGKKGFGYDPLFLPNGFTKTFAEMRPGIKNTISHRAKAIKSMVEFLRNKKSNE